MVRLSTLGSPFLLGIALSLNNYFDLIKITNKFTVKEYISSQFQVS